MKEYVFDSKVLSERIEGLRKDKKGKVETQEVFSKKIELKTGVSLSKATISKFENCHDLSGVKIINLIAIANYYGVSIDYLLGRTDSKSLNYSERELEDKTGLSNKAIKKLSQLVKLKEVPIELKLINYIIEKNITVDILNESLINYYKAKDKEHNIDDEIKKKYDISSLDLANNVAKKKFDNFLDETYQQLWYKEPSTLFDMPKTKESIL